MGVRQPTDLTERVALAAGVVLKHRGSIGPIELLVQMEFLDAGHVEQWKKGSPHHPVLERCIHCGAEKLRKTYQLFQEWVERRGLTPTIVPHVRVGVRGSEPLRVTVDGDEERERFFQTYYLSPTLTVRRAQTVREKLAKPPDLVAYIRVGSDTACSECQAPIVDGDLFVLEKQQPLCLDCADLDYLEFLPSGDATLSRRARKNSPLSAIVVRFIARRKRYERQGVLVTPEAIAKAEAECVADAPERARQRARAALARAEQDVELVDDMTRRILEQFPACPAAEARQIAEHTAERGSGRVGRSAAGRSLHPEALRLAVRAWIRHQHSNYDELLMSGLPRDDARERIAATVDKVAAQWRGS